MHLACVSINLAQHAATPDPQRTEPTSSWILSFLSISSSLCSWNLPAGLAYVTELSLNNLQWRLARRQYVPLPHYPLAPFLCLGVAFKAWVTVEWWKASGTQRLYLDKRAWPKSSHLRTVKGFRGGREGSFPRRFASSWNKLRKMSFGFELCLKLMLSC